MITLVKPVGYDEKLLQPTTILTEGDNFGLVTIEPTTEQVQPFESSRGDKSRWNKRFVATLKIVDQQQKAYIRAIPLEVLDNIVQATNIEGLSLWIPKSSRDKTLVMNTKIQYNIDGGKIEVLGKL